MVFLRASRVKTKAAHSQIPSAISPASKGQRNEALHAPRNSLNVLQFFFLYPACQVPVSKFPRVAATCASSTCTLTRRRGPALLVISGAACHGLGGDMPGAWHLGMVLFGVPVEHALRFVSLLDSLTRVLSLEACSRGSWGSFGDILLYRLMLLGHSFGANVARALVRALASNGTRGMVLLDCRC